MPPIFAMVMSNCVPDIIGKNAGSVFSTISASYTQQGFNPSSHDLGNIRGQSSQLSSVNTLIVSPRQIVVKAVVVLGTANPSGSTIMSNSVPTVIGNNATSVAFTNSASCMQHGVSPSGHKFGPPPLSALT